LDEAAIGKTICHFYSMLQDVVYAIEVTYRREPGADLSLAVSRNGSPLTSAALDGQTGIWVTQKLVLDVGAREFPIAERARLPMQRFRGEGSFAIDSVKLVDKDGLERSRFDVGDAMTVVVSVEARKTGVFSVIPAITLYRADGLLVSNHVDQERAVSGAVGDRLEFRLTFAELNLGDGTYDISVGLFRDLVFGGASNAYDLIGFSFEFEVRGNGPFRNGIFTHPSEWEYVQLPEQSTKVG